MLTLRENIFTSKRSKSVISNILHFLLFSEGKISGDQLFAVNSSDVGSPAPFCRVPTPFPQHSHWVPPEPPMLCSSLGQDSTPRTQQQRRIRAAVQHRG